MPTRRSVHSAIAIAMSVFMAAPPVLSAPATLPATTASAAASTEPSKPPMTQEELDQVVAPIALYPDSVLAQIFMASTYPLEVVQAQRWIEKNKDLKGDPLAVELEKQPWDPSVKSLVNLPQVLDMMDEKLDWTVKLGDAFIGQQKQVMDTVQKLRAKAQKEGNLESNEQQKVTVQAATPAEPQIIVVESADPQVIYVPTYNPTVVYGTWPYPAYPPYYYYPPGYVAGAAAVSFGVGLAVGMAWGYAWGGCNWHGGNVNVNVNRNINVNNTRINHNNYQNNFNGNGGRGNGNGTWQHNPSHRDGVPYRDNATAKQYGRGSNDQAQRARDSYRGQQSDLSRQTPRNDANRRGPTGNGGARPSQGNRQQNGGGQRGGGSARPTQNSGTRSGAFDGAGNGNAARNNSNRGQSSRQGSGRSGGGRAGGGARSGGGGGRRR